MEELKDIQQLTKKVSENIERNTFCLIAIDGVDGSGKTTIANKLESSLNIHHIDLDNDRYLQKQKGGYVNYIRYDVLNKDLHRLKEQNKSVIIEGICILEILERLGFEPAFHVYIKKLAAGLWLDGEHFDYTSSIEEEVKKDREELEKIRELSNVIEGEKQGFSYPESGIFHEKLKYHFKFKPDQEADILYIWEH